MRWRAVTAAAVVGALGMLPARAGAVAEDVAGVPWDRPEAVAFQVDPAHQGAVVDPAVTLPLEERWRVDLPDQVSYPLVADGRVFVTVRASGIGHYGGRLYAIDAASGAVLWGPVEVGGVYFWTGTAYDAGTVVVVNFDGDVMAFDAATGSLRWDRNVGGPTTSPPTAADGVAYVVSGSAVHALDLATGRGLWSRGVDNADHAGPAVTGRQVVTTHACGRTWSFGLDGRFQWYRSTACSGGGGRTAAVHGSRVYARDTVLGDSVLSAATGRPLARFDSDAPPAFVGPVGFMRPWNEVRAVDLADWSVRWRYRPRQDHLTSNALAVNDWIVVGAASGRVRVLDARNGDVLWSRDVGPAILAPDEHNAVGPTAAISAGGGLVLVPAGATLVALGAAGQ